MYRRAYWPNESTKTSPKTYSPTPEGYKRSIDPVQVDQDGRTSLHLALLHGGDDDVHLERVIKAGCDVNQGDKDKHRAVHYAAERGYTRCIQKLAKHGAELNVLDNHGYSALMLAARHNFAKTVRALTRAGANPNLENKKHELPLHYAVCNGHSECVEDLLAAKSRVNHPDEEGSTPLILATKFRHLDVMKLLLSAKAKTNMVDSMGKTALHWSAVIGSVQQLQLLLSAGAEVDIFDKGGFSPFVYTIQSNNPAALRCLLDANCDRSTVDGLNGTALGLACLRGHNECAKILLETGDDPDEVGFFGLTPLMSASFESHLSVMKTLFDYGANPNVAGRMGATPLIKSLVMICPQNAVSRHKIVAMLIRAGADVNMRVTAAGYFTCITNGRNCPLSFAMCSGYTSLVRMLILAGSEVKCSEMKEWYKENNEYLDTKPIIKPLREWKTSPKPLKYICRMTIRRSIIIEGVGKSKAIRTLPIAPVLQNYVDLSDLEEIEPEQAGVPSSDALIMTQRMGVQCPITAKAFEGTLLFQSFTNI